MGPSALQMEITFIPHSILSYLCASKDRQIHLNSALSALVLIAVFPVVSVLPHFCLAQALFHIPCPGCGITRSLLALENLNLPQSWRSNPAGLSLALLLCFQLFARPIALWIPRTSKSISSGGRWLSSLVGIALFAVWIERLL
jgi:hypothetical protein